MSIKATPKLILVCLIFLFADTACASDLSASVSNCNAAVGTLNKQFTMINGLDKKGNIPVDSGVIVHTIHGPGTGAAELHLKTLDSLTVDATMTCVLL